VNPHVQVLLIFVQVNAERIRIIEKIEAVASELWKSGRCAERLAEADVTVRGV